ncbi:terminase small subunit [Roseospira goensis]|uniref:Phage terminase Nu1 subunit (DNA packaging protein) n=1 Tax=Roseospira goensis TaxID=391922 RepID=A0A7W6S2H6_9PROT|nr:phage terminase Nu1 subunit (DNA packaging protein) [Roseospira goensis]
MDGRIVSQTELAAIMGVTAMTVRAWERKGMPVARKGSRGRPGQYNTADVMRWRAEQAAQAATGDTNAMDMEEAKRRKTAAEAALAEMDLALRRGELVDVETVGRLVAEEYATVRANIMAMPGELAPDLEHLAVLEIEELLTSKITDILDALSADGQFAPEEGFEPGPGGGAEAAAPA